MTGASNVCPNVGHTNTQTCLVNVNVVMLSFAHSFLRKGAPYIGECHFKDKDTVKANGGRWNGEVKKWEARTNEDLKRLIQCKVWLPVGMTAEGARSILDAIRESNDPSKGDGDCAYFDRRDPQRSEFNDEKDIEILNGHTRVYARHCDACNILLDSRLQFGLECDCKDGSCWKACTRCSRPLRPQEDCGCPQLKKKRRIL